MTLNEIAATLREDARIHRQRARELNNQLKEIRSLNVVPEKTLLRLRKRINAGYRAAGEMIRTAVYLENYYGKEDRNGMD